MHALDELLDIVRANSHGGASLVLFALVKTMSTQSGQDLYLLNKLKDLDAVQRQLAYRLMEAMVAGDNAQPEWQEKIATIEDLIRRG